MEPPVFTIHRGSGASSCQVTRSSLGRIAPVIIPRLSVKLPVLITALSLNHRLAERKDRIARKRPCAASGRRLTYATSSVVGVEPPHPPSFLGHPLPRGERAVARWQDGNRIV